MTDIQVGAQPANLMMTLRVDRKDGTHDTFDVLLAPLPETTRADVPTGEENGGNPQQHSS